MIRCVVCLVAAMVTTASLPKESYGQQLVNPVVAPAGAPVIAPGNAVLPVFPYAVDTTVVRRTAVNLPGTPWVPWQSYNWAVNPPVTVALDSNVVGAETRMATALPGCWWEFWGNQAYICSLPANPYHGYSVTLGTVSYSLYGALTATPLALSATGLPLQFYANGALNGIVSINPSSWYHYSYWSKADHDHPKAVAARAATEAKAKAAGKKVTDKPEGTQGGKVEDLKLENAPGAAAEATPAPPPAGVVPMAPAEPGAGRK
jgi:hypothetical protein